MTDDVVQPATGGVTVRFEASPGSIVELPFNSMPDLVGMSFAGAPTAVARELFEPFERGTMADSLLVPLNNDLYPDDLVEGMHLLALLVPMLNAILTVEGDGAFGWNYGFDRIRFVAPLRAGEGIRLRGSIAEVQVKDDGFLVRHACEVEIEGRNRPALVADWWIFWLPTPPTTTTGEMS